MVLRVAGGDDQHELVRGRWTARRHRPSPGSRGRWIRRHARHGERDVREDGEAGGAAQLAQLVPDVEPQCHVRRGVDGILEHAD
eukprot:9838839-Alexandrium_andersonii.AAC.1